MKKKCLGFLLLAIIISIIPISTFATDFTDMPNNWSTVAIEKAFSNGLLKGDNGKIMPNDNLTRAQMAAVVNRAFGTMDKAEISRYTDVSLNAWYYDDMAKAVHMQTFVGSGNKLNPDNNITREEAFVVLARAFKLTGASESVLSQFSDYNLVSQWAKDGVASLVSVGYIKGSNGKLNSKDSITRAEFAQIMDNLVKSYLNTEDTYTTVEDGNVMVNVPNVTLKDITILGDLIIGDGVGDGDVILDNVTVTGRMVVRGGGKDSIRIIGNSNIQNIIIARVDGIVRVFAEDGSEIGEVVVDGSDDVIIEGNIEKVTIIATNVRVIAINADIDTVNIEGENSELIVEASSTIKTINLNARDINVEVLGNATNIKTTKQALNANISVEAGAKVKNIILNGEGTIIDGEGTVETVEANANNIEVNTPNTKVIAAEGTTGVTASGKDVKPEITPDNKAKDDRGGGGGSGGPGGGDTPPPVEETKYTVTFQDYDGKVLKTQVLNKGSNATAPTDPIREGYRFTGWDTVFTNVTRNLTVTARYEVVIDEPVVLSWTDPSGDKQVGDQETIVIDISLLEGVDPISDVTVIMMWEKKESLEWVVVNEDDITITSSMEALINNSGSYQLVEGFVLEENTNITSDITFNKVGEYRVSVYAIKVNLK